MEKISDSVTSLIRIDIKDGRPSACSSSDPSIVWSETFGLGWRFGISYGRFAKVRLYLDHNQSHPEKDQASVTVCLKAIADKNARGIKERVTTIMNFGHGQPALLGSWSPSHLASHPYVSLTLCTKARFPDLVTDPLALTAVALRQSMASGDFVDTRFYAFSAKRPGNTAGKPRVVYANNDSIGIVLPKSTPGVKQASGLAPPFLVNMTGDSHINDEAVLHAYEYEQDSDLDDEEEQDDLYEVPTADWVARLLRGTTFDSDSDGNTSDALEEETNETPNGPPEMLTDEIPSLPETQAIANHVAITTQEASLLASNLPLTTSPQADAPSADDSPPLFVTDTAPSRPFAKRSTSDVILVDRTGRGKTLRDDEDARFNALRIGREPFTGGFSPSAGKSSDSTSNASTSAGGIPCDLTGGTSAEPPAYSASNCRMILVKGIAYRTWVSYVYFRYTGQVSFLPLKSAQRNSPRRRHIDLRRPPSCSPKSMYRLAVMLADERLQELAFRAIREGISKDNIIEEAFSWFTAQYSKVSEYELGKVSELRKDPELIAALKLQMKAVTSGEKPWAEMVLIALTELLYQN